jgi:tRNA nucleotidyltransferase/poly(A) polymerase
MELFDKEKIYVVGGTVRDILLGVEPKDLDFVAFDSAENIEKKLQTVAGETWRIDKTPQTVGAKFLNKRVEISVNRAPTIELDLEHRDFTINAMATRDGKIIDPHNGLKDLSSRLIRATKSIQDRFAEDPFRMLRAIRFVSTLGFRLEDKTKAVIELYSHSILTTSK